MSKDKLKSYEQQILWHASISRKLLRLLAFKEKTSMSALEYTDELAKLELLLTYLVENNEMTK